MKKLRHVFCMLLAFCMVLSLLPVMGHATREQHWWNVEREEEYENGTLTRYTDYKYNADGSTAESKTMELKDGKFAELRYEKYTYEENTTKVEGREEGQTFTETIKYEFSDTKTVITTVRTPGDIKTVNETTFDANGNRIKDSTTVDGKLQAETSFAYDKEGREASSKVVEYNEDGSVRYTYTVTTVYAENGYAFSFSGSDPDPSQIKLTSKKDDKGVVTEATATLGGETQTVTFDANGDPVKSVEKTSDYTVTTNYKDGRVISKEYQWEYGGTTNTTYEYDAHGNQVKMTSKYDDGDEYVYVTKYKEIVIPAEQSFEDVPMSEYYFNPVEWAVENGITDGTSETTFSPNDTCTRGQIVTFLWRAMGEPEPESKDNPFTDVKSDDYFCKAILWAKEAGITDGTSDTTFSPNDPCTRGNVVTFLWRAEGKPAMTSENPFKDVPAGQYYTEAVLWALAEKITDGTSETTFSPDTPCTRGQIVTFLYRDLEESL